MEESVYHLLNGLISLEMRKILYCNVSSIDGFFLFLTEKIVFVLVAHAKTVHATLSGSVDCNWNTGLGDSSVTTSKSLL